MKFYRIFQNIEWFFNVALAIRVPIAIGMQFRIHIVGFSIRSFYKSCLPRPGTSGSFQLRDLLAAGKFDIEHSSFDIKAVRNN
ncbi:hypothetical protein [uncultured Algoriphagus sp.]|uniref:hypothetical protein n=1 Tax=uncultured Algoriphagus sp. TaxID=417365 RepID=UPI00259048C5|nr:hypothetical protein [uncultured Algoriphagus sp.]